MAPFDLVTYHGISTESCAAIFPCRISRILFKVLKGISQSKKLLGEIRPDVIFAKGGFVSVPVVMAPKSIRFPSCCMKATLPSGWPTASLRPGPQSYVPALPHGKRSQGWARRMDRVSRARRAAARHAHPGAGLFKFPCQSSLPSFFMGGSPQRAGAEPGRWTALRRLSAGANIIHIEAMATRPRLGTPHHRASEYLITRNAAGLCPQQICLFAAAPLPCLGCWLLAPRVIGAAALQIQPRRPAAQRGVFRRAGAC